MRIPECVDTQVYAEGDITFGFVARLIEAEWVVTESLDPEISPGAALDAIDGLPVGEFLAPFNEFISASRPEYRGYRLWQRPFFLPPSIDLKLDTGLAKRVAKGIPAKGRPAVELSCFDQLPMIIIRNFDEPEFEEAAIAHVNANRDSPALVIDIRGNGGGNTPEKLIQALMNVPYPSWREASPLKLGIDVALEHMESGGKARSADRPKFTFSWNSKINKPGEAAYQGEIFILHDIGTKSAAEDFLMPFKMTSRATLIGETTCGSSGQPLIGMPFEGAVFAVGAKRQIFPNGDRFEGVGIQPDVPVSPSRADLSAQRDSALIELKKVV